MIVVFLLRGIPALIDPPEYLAITTCICFSSPSFTPDISSCSISIKFLILSNLSEKLKEKEGKQENKGSLERGVSIEPSERCEVTERKSR